MTFIETPRFPDSLAYYMQGGPSYNTQVITKGEGGEDRYDRWLYTICSWDLASVLRSNGVNVQYAYSTIRNLHHVCKGRLSGFRVKDFNDYKDDSFGVLGQLLSQSTTPSAGVGNGTPSLQLYKKYVYGSYSQLRPIQKPVATVTVKRNGSAVTVGSSAGNIALDYTTGIATFVADASSGATAITPGTTTQVILTTNPGTLIAGKALYLSGFTGADAALINGIAHTIVSVSGTGPFTFILSTNTSGKTITLGSGVGAAYPQASDTLIWTGTFDVPVRFDSDSLPAGPDTGLVVVQSMPIREIRV